MKPNREIKEEEERKKLLSFCRYLRKNPEFFRENNLHDLMLADQSKHVEEKKDSNEENKIENNSSNISNAEIKEEKENKEPEKKEKKKRKSKKKKEEQKELILPDAPAPLERQEAQSNLLEPGPVQEEKNNA